MYIRCKHTTHSITTQSITLNCTCSFTHLIPEPQCPENVDTCTNEVCTCKEPFIGIDCCDEEKCDPNQDVYFLIDTTLSNNRLAFCQTHYGVELMIAAINPGGDLVGTRMGSILYPKVDRGETPVANNFFNIGTSCGEILGDYNTMIDAFYNQEFPDNPYEDYVRGEGTYPAVTISKLTGNIKADGAPANRRRIVVVVTDGNNDGDTTELRQAVSELAALGVTIIAAGNDNGYRNEPDLIERFRQELIIIANGNANNVVIRQDSLKLAAALVEKMRELEALCDEHGKFNYNYNHNQCYKTFLCSETSE